VTTNHNFDIIDFVASDICEVAGETTKDKPANKKWCLLLRSYQKKIDAISIRL